MQRDAQGRNRNGGDYISYGVPECLRLCWRPFEKTSTSGRSHKTSKNLPGTGKGHGNFKGQACDYRCKFLNSFKRLGAAKEDDTAQPCSLLKFPKGRRIRIDECMRHGQQASSLTPCYPARRRDESGTLKS